MSKKTFDCLSIFFREMQCSEMMLFFKTHITGLFFRFWESSPRRVEWHLAVQKKGHVIYMLGLILSWQRLPQWRFRSPGTSKGTLDWGEVAIHSPYTRISLHCSLGRDRGIEILLHVHIHPFHEVRTAVPSVSIPRIEGTEENWIVHARHAIKNMHFMNVN